MNKYIVYSKENCSSCEEAKGLLTTKGIEFETKVLGKDYTVLEMFDVAPRSHRSFPMIAKDGEYLGGLKELIEDLS